VGWTAEFYEDPRGRRPVEKWIDQLSATKAAALIAAIEQVLEPHGLHLAGTSWLKPLGGGLHEFRIRHTADEIARMFTQARVTTRPPGESVLLRVFVHFHGQKIILLLGGYDKGRDPSGRRQNREIEAARARLAEWKRRSQR
jgi:putative component of toxin-antitoxin plasmid stabilization module